MGFTRTAARVVGAMVVLSGLLVPGSVASASGPPPIVPSGVVGAATPGQHAGVGEALAARAADRLAGLATGPAAGVLTQQQAILDARAALTAGAEGLSVAAPTGPRSLSGGGLRAAGTPAAAASGTEAEEEDDGPHGSWTYTAPLGDLDGDGARDLVALDVLLDEDAEVLTAMSGETGQPLWTADYTAVLGFTAEQDLTGDGIEDLFEVVNLASEWVLEGCDADGYICTDEEGRWTDAIRVRSGADGQVVWSHPVEGHFSYQADEAGEEYSSSGLIWSITVQDGSLVVDIGSGESSYRAEEAYDVPLLLGTRTEHSSTQDRYDVVTLAGADGTVVASDAHEVDGYLFVSTTVQGTLVERYLRPPTTRTCPIGLLAMGECTEEGGDRGYTVSLVHGGQPLWEVTSAATYQVAYPLGGDVDGDGADEYVMPELFYGATAETDRREVTLLDGLTGGERLREEATASSFTAVPGDGPADVLLGITFDYDTRTLRLARRASDLTTETVVTEHRPPETDAVNDDVFAFLFIDPGPGDGGLGAMDPGCALLVGWQVFEAPEGYVYPHSAAFGSEDCQDGSTRMPATTMDGDHWGAALGQVVGDAGVDLVTAPSYAAGPDSDFTPTLVDGRTGEVHWSLPAPAEYGFADIIGPGRVALVRDLLVDADTYRSTLEVVDADGALRWSRLSP